MRLSKTPIGKLYNYFITRLGMRDYRRGWLKGDCPYCGGEDKFGVHLETNRTNCFKCAEHPLPIRVVMDQEGIANFPESWAHIDTFEEFKYLETSIELLKEKPAQLPEGFRLINIGDSQTAKIARRKLKERGFNITNLALRGVGYCVSGDYGGRIIIPFYERGRLIYFNARNFTGLGPKFKNPRIEEFGIGKNLLIYNVDALELYRTIYILESATNALTLGDKATATGGKVISRYQISKYLQSSAQRFVIILDPYANHEALWAGMQLVYHKKVKVVLLPESKLEEDVNDIGKKKTLKHIKNQPWQNYRDLNKLYLRNPKVTVFNK